MIFFLFFSFCVCGGARAGAGVMKRGHTRRISTLLYCVVLRFESSAGLIQVGWVILEAEAYVRGFYGSINVVNVSLQRLFIVTDHPSVTSTANVLCTVTTDSVNYLYNNHLFWSPSTTLCFNGLRSLFISDAPHCSTEPRRGSVTAVRLLFFYEHHRFFIFSFTIFLMVMFYGAFSLFCCCSLCSLSVLCSDCLLLSV